MLIGYNFFVQDALTFGRPGCGAPVRTPSGRLRTTLLGNTEIRFQNNESVQKTIFNTIRYQQNNEDKEHYKRALGISFHVYSYGIKRILVVEEVGNDSLALALFRVWVNHRF